MGPVVSSASPGTQCPMEAAVVPELSCSNNGALLGVLAIYLVLGHFVEIHLFSFLWIL